MKLKTSISFLSFLTAAFAILATTSAIFSTDDSPSYEHTSIRGETVIVYGKGLYKHMPADVAIQGIAQDYVTLLLGVTLLLFSLFLYRIGNAKGKLLLSGTLLYFTVTYMIYLGMGMYNVMFLAYVALVATSLLALIMTVATFDYPNARQLFKRIRPVKMAAWFLLINCVLIALLWLSIIVPPLLDDSLYPEELFHFTTLIVQGFDLAIFLPLGLVSALLAIRGRQQGYIFTTIYIIFLALLMLALTSKVLFMASVGQNVVPVIFIMPTLALISIIFTIIILRKVKNI